MCLINVLTNPCKMTTPKKKAQKDVNVLDTITKLVQTGFLALTII